MNFKETVLLLGMSMVVPATSIAQDKVEASVGADLVSGYIWRGQDLGGVSIQPSLSVAYKGFSLGAWGSAGIESADTKELDLTLGYCTGGFSISVTDYWFNGGPGYFHYGTHHTPCIRSADRLRFRSVGSELVHQLCRRRRGEQGRRPGLLLLHITRRPLQIGRPGLDGRNRSHAMGQ